MATNSPALPGPEVEFSVRREDWSKYEIQDPAGVVWVRAILVKLFKVSQPDAPGAGSSQETYAAATQTVVASFFEHKRPPAPPTPIAPDEFDRRGEELDYSTLSEPWNEYLIAGAEPKVIRTRAAVTRIRILRDRVNPFGEPIINADAQVVISNARPARVNELGQ